jgi:hypothetical protein
MVGAGELQSFCVVRTTQVRLLFTSLLKATLSSAPILCLLTPLGHAWGQVGETTWAVPNNQISLQWVTPLCPKHPKHASIFMLLRWLLHGSLHLDYATPMALNKQVQEGSRWHQLIGLFYSDIDTCGHGPGDMDTHVFQIWLTIDFYARKDFFLLGGSPGCLFLVMRWIQQSTQVTIL